MAEAPDYRYDYDSDSLVGSAGNPPDEPPIDEDRFLASMARFMIEGDERDEARLLLACSLDAYEGTTAVPLGLPVPTLILVFSGPRRAYELLSDDSTMTYQAFHRAADALRSPDVFPMVSIQARASLVGLESADWRNELLAILDGRSVDNQAIGFKATKSYEGLRFRSESEVRIAQALDRAGVLYLPNCKARVGSKDRRRNSEADFLVCTNGKWGVLEVDGSQWHPPQRAADDHQRDRPFKHHGAVVVERFDAGECFENPDGVVRQFLALLKSR